MLYQESGQSAVLCKCVCVFADELSKGCQAVQQSLHITFLASSVCHSSWKLFLIMSMPSHSCVSVMMRGGANRILSPWVGLARRPFSASCRQKSQALWPAEVHKKELLLHSSTSLPYKAGHVSTVIYIHYILYISGVVVTAYYTQSISGCYPIVEKQNPTGQSNASYTKKSLSTANLIGQCCSSLFHNMTSNLKLTVQTKNKPIPTPTRSFVYFKSIK